MVELPDPGFKRWQVFHYGAEGDRSIEERRSTDGSEFKGRIDFPVTDASGRKGKGFIGFPIPAESIEEAWTIFEWCMEKAKRKLQSRIVVPPQGMPVGRGPG